MQKHQLKRHEYISNLRMNIFHIQTIFRLIKS